MRHYWHEPRSPRRTVHGVTDLVPRQLRRGHEQCRVAAGKTLPRLAGVGAASVRGDGHADGPASWPSPSSGRPERPGLRPLAPLADGA